MYNILIGGAAGQGIDTMAAILEKILKRSGYYVLTLRDFMSRVRGGHNFCLIRFGTEVIRSHSYTIDAMIALNDETILLHLHELRPEGFILCDSKLNPNDTRTIKINMDETANTLGNIRVSGSVALGATLKLFGEDLSNVADTLNSVFGEKLADINWKAIQAGYGIVEARYPHLNSQFGGYMMITGSEAIALGAIAAGLRFYTAYPMSPSTPIMVYLAKNSEKANLVVEQAEDEIAAINMAIGASFAGARAMTGTSGGGFSLMVEALGLAGMAEIPLVIVDVQRPGPATGLPTRTEQSDLKFVISAAQGEFPRMVIAPRDHKDAFYQTIRAFSLAERYQIPVIILSDQYLGDSSSTVEPFALSQIEMEHGVEEHGSKYLRYRFTESGISPRLFPGKTKNFVTADSDEHNEKGWITESAEMRMMMTDKRMRKLNFLETELQDPAFIGPADFEVLLVGFGSVSGSITEAVSLLNKQKGIKYAALLFGDVFPLPTRLLTEKAALAHEIINIEQNATGQLAGLIREKTGIVCTSSVLKYDGRQVSGDEIAERIRKGGQK